MEFEYAPDNYKKINVRLNRPLSDRASRVIFELEKLFRKEELFFKTNEYNLILFLREVDIHYFTRIVRKLAEENELQEEKAIFEAVISGIEAIKSYGLKGKKRLFVGYNKERKVRNRKQKEKERCMYYYADDSTFSKKNNQLPQEYEDRVICGDSGKVLRDLPDNCIDLVFTSPPYNFGLDYENHKDGVSWLSYFDKLFYIFTECIRVAKFGGRIIVNVQPLFSDYIPIHHIISNFFMRNKLIWKGEILWEKHNYNCKYTAWGSWKSPSNPYLKYTWEFLEVFCKGELRHRGDNKNIDITGDEFKKWVYAKWDIAPQRDMRKWGHPAMFPEELVKRALKLFTFERDCVLDPFNGVGTTTKVAKELNRRYLGIDTSPEYCKTAMERTKNAVFQSTMKTFL